MQGSSHCPSVGLSCAVIHTDIRVRYTLVAANLKTESTKTFELGDTPLTTLRCEIDYHLYIVHQAEAHYTIKLIKLEEAKVSEVV